MSGSIPYLGSKISLISKSEIRYEGILYTIDAQESIIALAKVRSFGTEDRPTEMPVPARDEVYEYIIFRGTDIKKIEVCDTPKQPSLPGGLHNDPAIVQHSAPTTFQAAPFSRQPLGPVGGGIGGMGMSYNNLYGQSMTQQGLPGTGGFPMGGASQASELSSGASGGGNNSGGGSIEVTPVGPPGPSSNAVIQAPIGAPIQQPMIRSDVLVSSRSSTPTARKSPVSDAGVQVSPPMSREEKKKSPKQQDIRQRDPRDNQQGPGRRQNMGPHQMQGGPRQYSNQGGGGDRGGGGSDRDRGGGGGDRDRGGGQDRSMGYQNHGYQGHPGQGYGFQGYRGRGRPSRRSNQSRRGGQGFNQSNRQRQIQDQALFEKEFDFEKANEDFEVLMTQLAKTKISENGDKKDDSGHDTGSAGESTETGEEDGPSFYDKTKSFFDSISCDAIERSKGKSQRPDWRQERKMNVETFGVSSTRRGYFPRGRGGYRGGYYRNYQGYYNYRGGGTGSFRGRGGKPRGNSTAPRQNDISPNSYSSAIRNPTPTK